MGDKTGRRWPESLSNNPGVGPRAETRAGERRTRPLAAKPPVWARGERAAARQGAPTIAYSGAYAAEGQRRMAAAQPAEASRDYCSGSEFEFGHFSARLGASGSSRARGRDDRVS